MLTQIPLELAEQIADELPDKTIWALTLVSRTCYTLFNPSLYRTVQLTDDSSLMKTLTNSPTLVLLIRSLEIQFTLSDSTRTRKGLDMYEVLFRSIPPGKAKLLNMTFTFYEDIMFRLQYAEQGDWLSQQTLPLLDAFFNLRLPQLRKMEVTWYAEAAKSFFKGTDLLPFLNGNPTLRILDWDFDQLRNIEDSAIPNLQWYRGSVASCAAICNGHRPMQFLIVRLDTGSSLAVQNADGTIDDDRFVCSLLATPTLTRLELLHPGDYGDWDNCTLSIRDLGRVSQACPNLTSLSASVDGAYQDILAELQVLRNAEDLHIWFKRDPVHRSRQYAVGASTNGVEGAIRRTLLPNLPRFRHVELESMRGRWSYYVDVDGVLKEGEPEVEPE